MFRESLQTKTARLKKIIAGFQKTYPAAHCELTCAITPELFKKYRSAADFADAPRAELEQFIKSAGFFRSKAKNIQNCCRKLVERHRGEVPRTMEELIQLDGVGRKTANVVLGNAFGINVGVVVDTHIMRLSHRLGLTTHRTPEKIEPDLMKLVPQKKWTLFSHLLIWHGRRRCFARKPDCENCEIKKICPQIGVKKF
jgi:endonuclease-3